MSEKIMTLHPEAGKQGVNISREKYDVMRIAILEIIAEQPGITFSALDAALNERLAGKFEGSISWYGVSVKLDLEARGEIERIPGSKPQRLRVRAG